MRVTQVFLKKWFLKFQNLIQKKPDLILEGRQIETGHAYRSLVWVSRLLGFGLLASILMNVTCSVLLMNVFPLKRIEPFLITMSPKTEQIVKIESFEDETQGFDLMTESQARNYVKLREEIDFQTESIRWEQVYWISSSAVFEIFKNLMNTEDGGVYLTRKNRGLRRSVTILSVSTLSNDPRILQVEWQSNDFQEGFEVLKKNWISTLTVKYEPQKVRFEDRYMNPLGFIVVAYGVTEKDTTEDL